MICDGCVADISGSLVLATRMLAIARAAGLRAYCVCCDDVRLNGLHGIMIGLNYLPQKAARPDPGH